MEGERIEVKKFLISLFFTLTVVSITTNQASAERDIIIATGTVGGSYYPMGTVIAKIWSENIEGTRAKAIKTAGTVENIQLMKENKADVAFLDGLYYYAYIGKGIYEGNPHQFIRAIVPLYPEPIFLLSNKDSGINGLADFRKHRVSIGKVGSGTEVTARELLEAAGLDPGHDIIPFNLGVAETATAFAENKIDAAIVAGSVDMAGIKETAAINSVEFLSVPKDIVETIIGKTPYWVPCIIPAGTYTGQGKDIETYASWNVLAVHVDLPADTVFEMVRVLYEKKEMLVNVRPVMESMRPENLKYILIPFHPGAERFYNGF